MSLKSSVSAWLAPAQKFDLQLLSQAVVGKQVLITGASYGIGEALAWRLSKAGARVILLARSQERLQCLCDEIKNVGGQAWFFSVDLRDAGQIDAVAAKLLKQFGSIDIVVHNAGKSIRRSLLQALDRPHDYQRCMDVNYLGPVRLQLALLPTMLKQGTGHIVNVSSVGVRLPPVAYWAAYLASKSAFDQWLSSGAPELRRFGIAVTSVYLGLVHTRMSAPTKEYAALPGLSADEAAAVLCRALSKKPRFVQPWWLGPTHWLLSPWQGLLEWLQWRWFSR